MKTTSQQPRDYKETQDGENSQSHAEQTEEVEVVLVPEGVGQEHGEGSQSAEHRAVEVEARAIGGGHSEVGQQGAVVEVHHGEETIVQTQAHQELQAWPGPRHPEGQEGESKEGAIPGEGLQALQHHLWGRGLGACPRVEQQTEEII